MKNPNRSSFRPGRSRVFVVCLALGLIVGGGGFTGAHAATSTGDPASIPEETVISSSEFNEARVESRAKDDSPGERKLKSDFLRDAAQSNDLYYSPTEVEVVQVNSDVTIVAPVDITVRSIEIVPDETSSTVTATADVIPGEIDAAAPSPGLEWKIKASGQYAITVKGLGSGLFTWEKDLLVGNDGDPAKDYWTYKRKASGTPYSRPLAPDARVQKLYIRNYPNAATYGILRNWVDWAPENDFAGNCDSNPKMFEVGFRGVTTALQFNDCLTNDFAKNDSVPGEARIQIDQGYAIEDDKGGALATGYMTTFAVAQGTTPVFNDQQQIVFYIVKWDQKTCTSTNKNATCAPVL